MVTELVLRRLTFVIFDYTHLNSLYPLNYYLQLNRFLDFPSSRRELISVLFLLVILRIDIIRQRNETKRDLQTEWCFFKHLSEENEEI